MLKKIVDVMENFRQIEDFIKSVSMVSDPGEELVICPINPAPLITNHLNFRGAAWPVPTSIRQWSR